MIGNGDVWYHSWQGGGGYGDPLGRDPESVAEDVARGAVSPSTGADIYGVILTASGEPNLAATDRQREDIRKCRLGASVVPDLGDAAITFAGSGILDIAGTLTIDFTAEKVSCGYCGHQYCRPRDNLLEHLGEVRSPLIAAGPVRGEDYDHARFHLRQLICPECGGLVDVEVAMEKTPRSLMKIGVGDTG